MCILVLFVCFVQLVNGASIQVFVTEDISEPNTTYDVDSSWPYNPNGTSDIINPALSTDVDMWSVIWYLGAFGGLVTFFIIVTCSEWCFGNHMYTRHGTNQLYINAFQSTFLEAERTPETPPPPYHLFAPPSYSDLFGTVTTKNNNKKKSKINIFIIPIHRGRRDETASAS
uniref:Uncharacterized protein n=1 Tax=Clastoptera arizonana TaxID=38151 RepID=A0A1B6DNI1_9HEMI